MVALAAGILCNPLCYLLNECFVQSIFLDELKLAQVRPVYKKGDPLLKQNYRPVSVLPSLSKRFEGEIKNQLSLFFQDKISPYMSGFRKGYNCERVLIRLVGNCKQASDSNMVYGIVLSDLSKVFDCLPPRLVVAKLQAYGLSHAACTLIIIANYFTERQQCVKTNGKRSAWNDFQTISSVGLSHTPAVLSSS